MEDDPAQRKQDELIEVALRQVRAASPGPPGDTTPLSKAEGPESTIPRDALPGYEILNEVHRGGQGVVYRAINRATGRRVAIKVLRSGPFAEQKDLARFEQEVEILAQLNHPNIVAVQDRGSAGGLHYFVMDYISGRTLDGYLRDGQPGIGTVLALFAKICDAVNAAHLKGVIHRDLKPSNIRVDERGEPHILDFGLAKSAASDAQGPAGGCVAMTLTGQFIGSLFWASPEQAEGSVAKIDVRTDVYSIGVMLYHALTGQFPYNVLGAMHDVLGNILREAPARPSSVRRRINNEVETIVLKCLAKERDRRYQNAGELGRDLRNYLTGQPIEAKRDSGWYVIRKTLGRYQPVVLAGMVVAASVVGGGAVAVMAWRRTAAALAEKSAAEQARGVALGQAEGLLRRSGQLSFALTRLIRATDPERTGDPAAARVLLAAVRETLATARRDLANDPTTLDAVNDLYGRVLINAGVLADEGPHPGAQRLIESALAGRRARGEEIDIAQSLVSQASLAWEMGDYARGRQSAAEAIALIYGLPRIARSTPAVMEIEGDAHNFLGLNLDGAGRHTDARGEFGLARDLRAALLGESSVGVAEVLSNRARSFLAESRRTEAIEELAASEILLAAATPAGTAPLHSDTAVMLNVVRGNLVDALIDRAEPGDADRAVPIARASLDWYRGFYGVFDPDHFLLAAGNNKLGRALAARGEYAEAIVHFREAVRIRAARAAASPDPAAAEHLGKTRTNLAAALGASGAVGEAEREFTEAAATLDTDGSRAAWAACHYQWARMLRCFAGPDRREDAVLHATIAWSARLGSGNLSAEERLESAIQVARVTLATGGPDRALTALGEACGSPGLRGALAARCDLVRGLCLAASRDYAEAEGLLVRAHGALTGERGAGLCDLVDCRRALVDLYAATGRESDAAGYR